MDDVIVQELKTLATTLGLCINSFREDIKTIDCKSPETTTQTLMPSLLYKMEQMIQCTRSIQTICKTMIENKTGCLPCLSSDSVTKETRSKEDVHDGAN